jgi:hypothetical protein
MTRFQDLSAITAADLEAAIDRNDPDELVLVPITAALLAEDPIPVIDACVRLSRHAVPRIRANAIVSLGHLARRFRSLDEQQVRPVIEAGLRDDDEVTRSSAQSAADEIHQFLHWTFPGHVFGCSDPCR